MRKKINRPNPSQCGGCPDWDDINGCWANVEDVDSCSEISEDGYYDMFDEDLEDDLDTE